MASILQGQERHSPAKLQQRTQPQLGEDMSPHTQHSRSELELGLRFSDVPLENFTSTASLPSREHNGAGAEEASFLYRKARTRFNDVKVKHGRAINPCDKHPDVCLSLGAFKSRLGFFLPEGLRFSRESPRRGGVGWAVLSGRSGERNTTVPSGFKNLGIDVTCGRAPPIAMRRLVPPASL